MTKETAKGYLPLVKALSEGKTIQYLSIDGWVEVDDPSFIASASSYRIKPEPLVFECWVGILPDGSVFATSQEGYNHKDIEVWRKIKAVEVP